MCTDRLDAFSLLYTIPRKINMFHGSLKWKGVLPNQSLALYFNGSDLILELVQGSCAIPPYHCLSVISLPQFPRQKVSSSKQIKSGKYLPERLIRAKSLCDWCSAEAQLDLHCSVSVTPRPSLPQAIKLDAPFKIVSFSIPHSEATKTSFIVRFLYIWG